MTTNNLQITNPKPVTDNAAVLDAAKTLLSAAGYNSGDIEVALDAITTAKKQSPNKEKVKMYSGWIKLWYMRIMMLLYIAGQLVNQVDGICESMMVLVINQ